MNKNTLMTLSMGLAMSAMLLTSCGKKKAEAGQDAAAEGEQTEQTAAKKAVSEKPADLHVYKSSDIAPQMPNKFAHVAFDKSVVSTLDNMMEGNTALEALYFDHKFNMLGTASFSGCTNLKEIYADDIIEVVGDEAFKGCTSLKEFKMTTSTLGLDALNGCTSLEKLLLDDRAWKIREGALANCTSLKTVILPMTIDEIEEGALKGSNAIEELAIPFNFKDRIFTFTSGCKGIKSIYVLTPQEYAFPTNGGCKTFNKKQCTAYVPDALIKDFQNDATWGEFAAIKPLSESGYFNADSTIK